MHLFGIRRQEFQRIHTEYWRTALDQSSDSKALWNHIKCLLQPNSQAVCPLSASALAQFFDDKVATIRSATANAAAPSINRRAVPPLSKLAPYSVQEVTNQINSAPNKHCELDPIPTWLVKKCCTVLAPVITDLINQSLTEGIFPENNKHAVVKPIIKKPKLDPFELKSWRPIANVTFISKLIERLAIRRFNEHSTEHHLLPMNQSAYRAHHSTETAVTTVVDDIARAVDSGEMCALVSLDLSAAFDTVDHAILLEVLHKRFAVEGEALQWFGSYLTGRTVSVRVGADISGPNGFHCGVPQGSVAGATEFISYTEDFQELMIIHSVNYHLYADDSQLSRWTSVANVDVCRSEISECVMAVQQWCASRRLQLNSDKTELIWFGTRATLSRFQKDDLSIHVGSTVVAPVDNIRILGVQLDSNLDMRKHISQVASACFFHLRRLRQMRKILSREHRQRLVSAVILSRIDYCNAILVGLPDVTLLPLQRVMNAAARFVADLGPRDHISQTMRELHWLPIRQRIDFKLATIMHGIVHGSAPEYLRNKVTPVSDLPGRRHLRSAAHGLFHVPRIRTRHGSRAFSVAGPTVWNSLPQTIRNISSVVTFKKQLKTHLFNLIYNV